jgi:hypothetical protein
VQADALVTWHPRRQNAHAAVRIVHPGKEIFRRGVQDPGPTWTWRTATGLPSARGQRRSRVTKLKVVRKGTAAQHGGHFMSQRRELKARRHGDIIGISTTACCSSATR